MREKRFLYIFVPGDLELWPLDLKFSSQLHLVQRYVSIKFEDFMAFRFRENRRHCECDGRTERRTDGRGVTLNAAATDWHHNHNNVYIASNALSQTGVYDLHRHRQRVEKRLVCSFVELSLWSAGCCFCYRRKLLISSMTETATAHWWLKLLIIRISFKSLHWLHLPHYKSVTALLDIMYHLTYGISSFFIPSTSFCSLSSWFTSFCAYHLITVITLVLTICHSIGLSPQT